MGSQVGQDKWILSLIEKGTFLDIGCRGPEEINNTFLLEQNGWTGVSIDIVDYSEEWKSRKTDFICADALTFDYTLLGWHFDYLSLDIEGLGDRFNALKRVMECGLSFKLITIEHDSYREGHYQAECVPQRDLLKSLGYILAYEDVKDGDVIFEDWWINLRYVKLCL